MRTIPNVPAHAAPPAEFFAHCSAEKRQSLRVPVGLGSAPPPWIPVGRQHLAGPGRQDDRPLSLEVPPTGLDLRRGPTESCAERSPDPNKPSAEDWAASVRQVLSKRTFIQNTFAYLGPRVRREARIRVGIRRNRRSQPDECRICKNSGLAKTFPLLGGTTDAGRPGMRAPNPIPSSMLLIYRVAAIQKARRQVAL